MNAAVTLPGSGLRTAFQSHLRLSPGTEDHLAAAIRETLQHPGNMIRAELAYRIARSYGISNDRSEALAIAIEYFHTASLLFDDLPCMDNAEQRRGVPCVHRSYGEAAAILAALALINRAYGLLWSAVAESPANCQSKALAYVERHLGGAGLLNGQSKDLYCHDDSRHARLHQQIAMGKTVSLIRLPLVVPALLGGASERQVCLLERLAIAWGLGYQIVDDLKDVLHAEDEAGKTSARDTAMNRPNLALTIGVTGAFRRAARLLKLSDRVIARLRVDCDTLAFLQKTRARFQIEMAALARAGIAQSL